MGCESDDFYLNDGDLVRVTRMNHIVEVQHMEKMNHKANIKKLDADRYLDISTGEIKEFDRSENRQGNYNSLRQTFKKLRYLINNNFLGHPNELHVTLTYRENMTDTKRLYRDFDKFIKRVRYRFKKQSTIDYISVIEPQERGAWHSHLLLRFNDLDKVYIPSKELAELWGHGFIKIKSLKDIDNIGAYLSAYLSDVELEESDEKTVFKAIEEEREVVTKTVEGKEKRFIKGGRLHMYPSGMNLFRKSKGIKYPERKDMWYKDIKKVVGSTQPHYHKSYKVEKDDFENTITFLQYNMKRDNDESK